MASQVLVALDPSSGIEASSFAAAWSRYAEEQRTGGRASVMPAREAAFLYGVVELVAIPLAVNLGSSALYDMVKRMLRASRAPAGAEVDDLEISEALSARGETILVVRAREDRR